MRILLGLVGFALLLLAMTSAMYCSAGEPTVNQVSADVGRTSSHLGRIAPGPTAD